MKFSLVEDRKTRIIECHNGIHGSMKQALEYALEAGKLLTEQKEEMEYGEWTPFIRTLPFDDNTAYRYMKLFEHRNKIPTVGNLQEAYKQIETIEAQQKLSDKARQRKRIVQFRETGSKPPDWKRGTDDKEAERLQREDEEREQRVEQAKKNMEEARLQKEQQRPKVTTEEIDQILEESEKVIEYHKKYSHLNLSGYADNMNQSEMFAAIEKYINTFDDKSRQLEATHNLIKKLKMIANDLQQDSAGNLSN